MPHTTQEVVHPAARHWKPSGSRHTHVVTQLTPAKINTQAQDKSFAFRRPESNDFFVLLIGDVCCVDPLTGGKETGV